MDGTTLLEGAIWFASMMAVAFLSFRFSWKLGQMIPERAAMPSVNSTEGRRLFFIIGINYATVAIACSILSVWSGPAVTERINTILHEWWLVELFIFFNIITSYCLYTAIKRVVVNV
jgi:hypothetical protein